MGILLRGPTKLWLKFQGRADFFCCNATKVAVQSRDLALSRDRVEIGQRPLGDIFAAIPWLGDQAELAMARTPLLSPLNFLLCRDPN